MAKRLTKIVTRTGDDGTTGLGDGSRISKDSRRIEALGDVDELNSQIGLVIALGTPPGLGELLQEIQQRLFDAGAELSLPGHQLLGEPALLALEERLQAMNRDLPPLTEFVLPGGSPAAAACHVARSVCRRAERRLIRLGRREPVNATLLKYLNRLSDLLFVLARRLARGVDPQEPLWHPPEKTS
jgi:cob(I)alamin adenosyltransferase